MSSSIHKTTVEVVDKDALACLAKQWASAFCLLETFITWNGWFLWSNLSWEILALSLQGTWCRSFCMYWTARRLSVPQHKGFESMSAVHLTPQKMARWDLHPCRDMNTASIRRVPKIQEHSHTCDFWSNPCSIWINRYVWAACGRQRHDPYL